MLTTSAEEEFEKGMKTEKQEENKEGELETAHELDQDQIKTEITEHFTESESLVNTRTEDKITLEDVTSRESEEVVQKTESELGEIDKNSGRSDSDNDEPQNESEINDIEKESESESSGVQKTEKMFRTLSIETDINVAPVNWLRGDDGEMGESALVITNSSYLRF
jgi:uncharacterized membrane-anchored protein YhcB (DUF1043 family)